MAGKAKGGLGKTARSSTLAREQAAAKERPSGHLCGLCGKAVLIKDHLPVMRIPGRKMTHYHRACYEGQLVVPAGKAGTNDQGKGKKR